MADERERALQEMASGPRNVRLSDLIRLMRLWNFDERTMHRGGHGIIFQHQIYRQVIVTVARPKGGQKVKFCYVKDCIEAIGRVEDLEEATNA